MTLVKFKPVCGRSDSKRKTFGKQLIQVIIAENYLSLENRRYAEYANYARVVGIETVRWSEAT